MDTLELSTVNRGINLSKRVLELQLEMQQLDIIYNSTGGVSETLTQADLDSRPEYSGLTKQQVDDAFYAMTATLKTDINNAMTALTHLACRAST